MNILLSVSIALLAGLLMTRAFKPFKLPAVTAYLIAGVLIGPYCLGALHIEGLGFTSMEEIISKRKEAREAKNWEVADKIRIALDNVGIILKDSKEGTTWELK